MTQKFIPTQEQRDMVEDLAGKGLTQTQIAALVAHGIDIKTLYKNFRKELDQGKARAIATVSGHLMDKIEKGDAASIFFYLKTQGRWTERHEVDHSSTDGTMATKSNIDYSKLDPETMEKLLNATKGDDDDGEE